MSAVSPAICLATRVFAFCWFIGQVSASFCAFRLALLFLHSTDFLLRFVWHFLLF
jgi:hypothetical protein